jgi:hypothetical protein
MKLIIILLSMIRFTSSKITKPYISKFNYALKNNQIIYKNMLIQFYGI